MAAAITVGSNSWVTEVEANSYMEARIHAGDYWVDSATDNLPALITAYKWLVNSGRYTFPSVVNQIMKDSQCEYALYLLQHQPDIDLRMGLTSQGVVEAGIVKEKYSKAPQGIPIPPIIHDMLRAYITNENYLIFDLERDEEQLTSYDAVSNLERDT